MLPVITRNCMYVVAVCQRSFPRMKDWSILHLVLLGVLLLHSKNAEQDKMQNAPIFHPRKRTLTNSDHIHTIPSYNRKHCEMLGVLSGALDCKRNDGSLNADN